MPGGLMQIQAEGAQNVILHGNPTKSFFKSAYSKHTNFALQKFRVDFDGAKTLRLNEETTMKFKIPRHAELLMDCYVSVNLPNIWSPIMPPVTNDANPELNTGVWVPYEFKWIENLGAMMIQKITVACGNYTLQEYSGDYILSSVERDFPEDKKDLFYKMIGHLPEYTDPGNSGSRVNVYPNAFYTENENGAEPSIRGRQLIIPINAWFCLKSQNSFPLTSLQYNELSITVTFRPIQHLFRIRDVFDRANNYPYVAPNFNLFYMQMHRFLQTPPDVALEQNSFDDRRTLWDADIHLVCTYGFLSEEEQRLFAKNEQKYLIKQVKEYTFKNIAGTNKISLDSLGLISGLLFSFKRNDVHLRNEWSNRTNWPYNYQPFDIVSAPTTTQNQPTALTYPIFRSHSNTSTIESLHIGPGVNANGNLTGWHITGDYKPENSKMILENLAILFNGNYRENQLSHAVFNYIEKYTRTSGGAEDGIYYYSFAINDSILNLQPSGAANLSKFESIDIEILTITPPLNPNAQTLAICDPETNEFVGVNKPSWKIYDYDFDLTIYEERFNIVHFVGGNVGLTYAT